MESWLHQNKKIAHFFEYMLLYNIPVFILSATIVASMPEVQKTPMLVYIVGKIKIPRTDGLQWHGVRTKFKENPSVDSVILIRPNTCTYGYDALLSL